VPELINAMYNQKVYITEKLDGTSCTMYFYKTHFGVCSRNWEKQNTEGCLYWQMAKKYKVAEKLRERYLYMSDLAIQGEIVGPGIQKNPLGLSEHTFCIFNVYDILQERYCPIEYVEQVSAMLQLPMVRLLERNKTFTITLSDELRNLAEGTYVSGKEREGIVVRTMVEQKINGLRASFKIINLNYKGN
jgi:RNA ligase (TIGR02306 family)